MIGVVSEVVLAKGFGFIGSGTDDIFFHVNDLKGLEFGDGLLGKRVEFELTQTAKGARARDVRKADR